MPCRSLYQSPARGGQKQWDQCNTDKSTNDDYGHVNDIHKSSSGLRDSLCSRRQFRYVKKFLIEADPRIYPGIEQWIKVTSASCL